MCPIFSGCGDTAVWMLRIKSLTKGMKKDKIMQGVSGGIVNILRGGSMEYSE